MEHLNERVQALAQHLVAEQEYKTTKEAIGDITESSYDEQLLQIGNSEWLVVTDEEADELWDEELEHYIDDCILPEVPEHFRMYFDSEKWKDDARMDGRGHSLNRYDGCEYEERITRVKHAPNGEKILIYTDYYLYRQN